MVDINQYISYQNKIYLLLLSSIVTIIFFYCYDKWPEQVKDYGLILLFPIMTFVMLFQICIDVVADIVILIKIIFFDLPIDIGISLC